MTVAVAVHDLRKSYGDYTAVDGVSFAVEAGEIFGIIGPNGAGKTTVVECLQGLRRPDGGDLRVLGLDPWHDKKRLRPMIGSQLQESGLPDRMRVREAVDLFSQAVPRAVDVRRSLDEWGLGHKSESAFGDLSGGEQQRLFVALALIGSPQLVFLDEMTTGLDPTSRRVAWDLISAIRGRGTTVVLVTHFMDEAEFLCDRVAVLNNHTMVAIDAPSRLIASHAGGMVIRLELDASELSWIANLPGCAGVEIRGTEIVVEASTATLLHLGAELVGRRIEPRAVRVSQGTLEDVYIALTGP